MKKKEKEWRAGDGMYCIDFYRPGIKKVIYPVTESEAEYRFDNFFGYIYLGNADNPHPLNIIKIKRWKTDGDNNFKKVMDDFRKLISYENVAFYVEPKIK